MHHHAQATTSVLDLRLFPPRSFWRVTQIWLSVRCSNRAFDSLSLGVASISPPRPQLWVPSTSPCFPPPHRVCVDPRYKAIMAPDLNSLPPSRSVPASPGMTRTLSQASSDIAGLRRQTPSPSSRRASVSLQAAASVNAGLQQEDSRRKL